MPRFTFYLVVVVGVFCACGGLGTQGDGATFDAFADGRKRPSQCWISGYFCDSSGDLVECISGDWVIHCVDLEYDVDIYGLGYWPTTDPGHCSAGPEPGCYYLLNKDEVFGAAFGGMCSVPADCRWGHCVHLPDGAGVCTEPCTAEGYCRGGFVCDPAADLCVPPERWHESIAAARSGYGSSLP